MSKPQVLDFIKWVLPHSLNRIAGEYPILYAEVASDPWGYILGTSGQKCTESLIKQKRENYMSWPEAEYNSAARRWLGMIVTDCQGAADGYLTQVCKVKTDVNAAHNYSDWCGKKGSNMSQMPTAIGTALFIRNSNGRISHVGWICGYDTTDKPLVWEARGLREGCVITRFAGRGWNLWGMMDKVFDYGTCPIEYGDVDVETTETPRTIRLTSPYTRGDDVKQVQQKLTDAGYSPGTIDGVFGPNTEKAVRAFQEDNGLAVVGYVGPKTRTKLGL